MNEETRKALHELKAWCCRYNAVIEKSPHHEGLIRIRFGADLNDLDYVHFGQFDRTRTTVMTEQRESF
jgi:hypothetical protein